VDVHVGSRLFANVVSSATGLLKHTSRIIISNEVNVLARADAVSLAIDGEIHSPAHRDLLYSVTHASLQFFSSVPTGRIIGLFTDGQKVIDEDLPELVGDFMKHSIQLLFETWVVFGFHPIMPAAVVVLLAAMIFIIKAALESPRYQQSLDGAATIRAFSNHQYANELMFQRMDDYSCVKRSEEFIYTWVDLSISVLREMALNVAYIVTVLGISSGARINHSHLVAIRLVTSLQMARFQHLTHKSYTIRTGFSKSARYIHYSRLKTEHEGQVVFDNVTARTIQHSMALFGLLKPPSGSRAADIVLLTGTVRDNLDPFRKHADSEIQRCLIAVGMSDRMERWSTAADMPGTGTTEAPKVLVLDESTAAIDSGTSNLLHQLIRDDDMVLVVEDGKICESGAPDNLRHDPESHFAQLVKQSVEKADPSNTC
ncbi:hypothetical protein DL89DRAFT_297683, partial [Linderina pennispora]